jgi:hypothetical protein
MSAFAAEGLPPARRDVTGPPCVRLYLFRRCGEDDRPDIGGPPGSGRPAFDPLADRSESPERPA